MMHEIEGQISHDKQQLDLKKTELMRIENEEKTMEMEIEKARLAIRENETKIKMHEQKIKTNETLKGKLTGEINKFVAEQHKKQMDLTRAQQKLQEHMHDSSKTPSQKRFT